MKKNQLLKQIVANVKLDVLSKAAKASHAEATHEQSRRKTRSTPAAEPRNIRRWPGAAGREILDAIKLYETMAARDFASNEPIDTGALVELEMDGAGSLYFIGPKSGGLEIKHQRKEIMVITPQSPLGQNLMGRKAGDNWTAKVGGSVVEYQIISVR